MMRSLYSGISGLRNHQTRMDVIGNNIANVNTAGYKTARVIFQDIFSQNVASGMANNQGVPGQGGVGGTNPTQIGLGIRLSTVDVIHSRAAFQRTDRETDMMINGDGFFIVRGPDGDFYTRAGNFDIDSDGYLVTSMGFYVMGRSFDLEMGVVDPGLPAYPAFNTTLDLTTDGDDVPAGRIIPAGAFLAGSIIPANSFGPGVPTANHPDGFEVPAGTSWPSSAMPIRVPFDMLAATVNLSTDARSNVSPVSPASQQRNPVFGLIPGPEYNPGDENGLSRIRVKSEVFKSIPTWENMTQDQRDLLQPMIDSGDIEDLDPAFFNNFPNEEVSLPGFSVADNGDVSVILQNRKVVVGRIAIAMFANPPGLEKAGNSLYRESASSGPVVVTEAFQDGAGKIDGGGLEMSNVDLSNEFTDMIVTQRGFQANSRIITVSDTMLEELVNLKR